MSLYIHGSFCFLYFKPCSSLTCSEPSVVLDVKAFFTEISVKLAVILLLCWHSYSFCLRFRKFSKVISVSRICCYFWSWLWYLGRIIKLQEVYCSHWKLKLSVYHSGVFIKLNKMVFISHTHLFLIALNVLFVVESCTLLCPERVDHAHLVTQYRSHFINRKKIIL